MNSLPKPSISEGQFLRDELKKLKTSILQEWEQAVRESIPEARHENRLALINSLPEFLDQVANLLPVPMTWSLHAIKPITQEHGRNRIKLSQYTLTQVIQEYRILAAIVFKHLETQPFVAITPTIVRKIHEFIDEGISGAAEEFSKLNLQELSKASNEAKLAIERLEHLQKVTEVVLAGSTQQEKLFRDILVAIQEAFQSDTVNILVLDETGQYLKVKASSGLEAEIEKKIRIPKGKGVAGKILSTNQPLIVPDLTHIETASPILHRRGVKSLMGSPLQLMGTPFGVIHTGTLKLRNFTQSDLTLLQLMAERIAIGIEHARLFELTQFQVTKLEKEKAIREQFIYSLSHDLRGPLTIAQVNIQLIKRSLKNEKSPDQFINRIERSISRIDTMIQNLLDSASLSEGKKLPLQLEQINLYSFTSNLIDDLQETCRSSVVLCGDQQITGDWSKMGLQRILENLITNACKYGDPNRPIEVTLLANKDQVEILVHNQGEPIPSELQENIFKPFFQAPSKLGNQKKGWGIGLSLAKGLTESHGGTIEVKSDEKSGTTFRVCLPIHAN